MSKSNAIGLSFGKGVKLRICAAQDGITVWKLPLLGDNSTVIATKHRGQTYKACPTIGLPTADAT